MKYMYCTPELLRSLGGLTLKRIKCPIFLPYMLCILQLITILMHNLSSTREIFHRIRTLGRQRYNVKVKLACSFLTIINFFVSVHAWKKSCTLSPRKKVSGQQCLQPVHSFESNNKVSAEWWTESVITWVTSKSINFCSDDSREK